MGEIVLSEPAEHDRQEIWDTISDDNIDAADRFIDKLESAFLSLSDSPKMGRSRSEDLLVPGLRSFPVGNYAIFYYEGESGGVVIVRILHAARDVGPLLDE